MPASASRDERAPGRRAPAPRPPARDAEVTVEVVEAGAGGDFTPHPDPAAVVAALASTYGIPVATLEGYEYYHTGHKVFALRRSGAAPADAFPAPDVYRVGLYVARVEGALPHGLRLTLDGAMLWSAACRWWVELDDEAFAEWMRGGEPPVPTDPARVRLPPAPVPWFVVRHRGLAIGCSRVAKERLMNFVPKERRTPGP